MRAKPDDFETLSERVFTWTWSHHAPYPETQPCRGVVFGSLLACVVDMAAGAGMAVTVFRFGGPANILMIEAIVLELWAVLVVSETRKGQWEAVGYSWHVV